MFNMVTGFEAYDFANLMLRVMLGVFFVISGYHKLFNPTRRASLKATFEADGCYSPALMFVIPIAELLGGLGVMFGALTIPASVGLVIILAGACVLDGLKRVQAYQPLDKADALADVLYLPEVLYMIMLSVLIFTGPGNYSLDAIAVQLFN